MNDLSCVIPCPTPMILNSFMQIGSLSRVQETINAYLARIDKSFDPTKWEEEGKQFKIARNDYKKEQ